MPPFFLRQCFSGSDGLMSCIELNSGGRQGTRRCDPGAVLCKSTLQYAGLERVQETEFPCDRPLFSENLWTA